MYRKQPSLSQHFLVSRELIGELVRESSVTSSDLVLEIGPGTGNITTRLLTTGCRILAVELDASLASRLPKHPRLNIVKRNILDFQLPDQPYKVFSNLPFAITGGIFRKLFLESNPPQDAYLFMQSEAATKFLPNGTTHSLISILIYPWFESKILHQLRPTDFYPHPRVNACLLQIRKRKCPLVSNEAVFRDFVTYTYTYNPLAKYIPPETWIRIYHFLPQTTGSFENWLQNQSRLHKIHRTRTDPEWKNRL